MSDTSRHILKTFGSKILYAPISVVSGIIIARILGPAGKGEYAMVLLLATMVVSLGSLNIGETAIYFFNKKKVAIGTIIASNSMFIIVSSLLYAGAILCLSRLNLLPWKELSHPYLISFVCLLIPLLFLQVHFLDLLRCKRKFDAYNVLFLIQPLVYLAMVILFVYFLHLQVIGALISASVSYLTVLTLNFILTFRRQNITLKLDSSYLKAGISYGVKGHIGNLFQKFNMRLDQFFVSPYWGSAMLGNYSIAVTLSEMIFYIPDSVGLVTLASIAGSGKEAAEHLTTKSMRISALLMAIVIGFFYLLARMAVHTLYGNAFDPAVSAIYYLLPGNFFVGISKILSKYFSGMGRPEINTYTSAISAAATITLCIALIPNYGIVGAAIASTIAYGIRAAVDIYFFLRTSGCALPELLLPKKEDFQQLREVMRGGSGA